MVSTERPPKEPRARKRAELAEFLKVRRARLTPGEVGLPSGARRRLPGLRREEVALLAGVGITWYTWLEQGRPINASAEVLDAVARTLRLDQAERWHLYRLAEAMPRRAWEATTAVPGWVRTVLAELDPVPAVLVNTRFDILASNDAMEDLFWDWHSLPCVHRNLLWCLVTEPTAREQMPNYPDVAGYLTGRLRAEYAGHVGDPDWEEDIRRLAELSDEFAELWARHEVVASVPTTQRLIHRTAGELTFDSNELAVAGMGELRIRVYTPADDRTWQRLPATRKRPPAAEDQPKRPEM